MARPVFARFCNAVCEKIRFRPDRPGVYEELLAHLQDSAALLEEEEGMEGAQAAEEAVKRMGDAEEIGILLDKAHSPLLGWLWMFSKWFLGISLVLAFFALWPIDELRDQFYRPWPEEMFHADRQEILKQGGPSEKVRLGAYTFQIEEATLQDTWNPRYPDIYTGNYGPEVWQTLELNVTLRSYTPLFYLDEPKLSPYLSIEGSEGQIYLGSWHPDADYSQPLLQISSSRPLFFWQECRLTMYMDYGQREEFLKNQWLDLVYEREGNTFRIRIPLEEVTEHEKTS